MPTQWDDLRVVLALARGRTLEAAARRLGADPSTVFRRARMVEKRMGVKLFERSREGYLPTEAGEAAAMVAERVESEVLGLEAQIGCGDAAPAGTLRVTTTDTVQNDLLIPRLPQFAARFPDVRVELAASNAFADLIKRDADVAIRPTRKPPGHLAGRSLGAVPWAVYAPHELARAPRALESIGWVIPDESLAELPAERWRRQRHAKARVALVVNSIAAVRLALAQGLGMGVLPCFVGGACAELARIGDPIPELDSELWILTHRDYRGLARVRAFFDFALESISPSLLPRSQPGEIARR
ncbi:MAG: LysR family transcriptional regulator [Betaproteobacteria bacterium]|nr:LysR family transcriptional regulator [Betaproteobacteria bacterium]